MKPPIPDPTDTTPIQWRDGQRSRMSPMKAALIVLGAVAILCAGLLHQYYVRGPVQYRIHVIEQR